MKKIARPAVVCLVVVLLLLSRHLGEAQQAAARYFPETGHYLAEPFLSLFESQGGVQTWGAPITEAIDQTGRLVQYFRAARMECVPQAQGQCEARFSPLGELLGQRMPRTAPAPQSLMRSGLCQHYEETGHNICFSFLSFYLEHGGSQVFGPPVTELTFEPGLITQYFERARVEWHTDAPAETAMQLGPIGEEYFRATKLDPALLLPVEATGAPTAPVPATPTDRIAVGSYVRVVDTEGTGLRFRAGPGVAYETVQMLEDSAVLRVVGGPEVADGYYWWYLDYSGLRGWCAAEWLDPTEGPNAP